MSVSANGGTPESIIKVKTWPPIFPQILPDGKSVLYTAASGATQGKITVQPLNSGEPKELFAGYGARYLPTGHILYREGNGLSVIPFDLDRLEVKGGPVPVLEGVSQAATSASGILAYIPGSAIAETPGVTLVWVNRQGKEEALSAPPNDYGSTNSAPRISPDGTRVALTVSTGGNANIWIWDLARETMTRLTFEEGEDCFPLWTKDGKRIVYRSSRGGTFDINEKAADGTGEVEKLGSLPNLPGPFSWSKDGKILLVWYLTISPLHTDIGMMSMEGDHVRKLLLPGKYNKDHPQISPDGRWMAYASNESGQNEVYVRPFPEVNKGQWQASTNGGNGPLWAPDGRELFYRNGESVMAVSVETEPVFKPGKPQVLFRGTYYSNGIAQIAIPMWDISPDGKRFLMMKESQSAASAGSGPRKINIVINWFEELKQRVPVK